MKQVIWGFACLSLALSINACGDDDSSDGNNGGQGNQGGEPAASGGEPAASGGEPAASGGEPATSGGAATGTGGAPSGNVECDPSADGVCQNPTDCPSVQDGSARITSGMCGQNCLGMAETCAVECIVDETSMTEGCAACYAAAVGCTAQNCLAECIDDPEADACKECQVTEGCRDAFNICSGLPE